MLTLAFLTLTSFAMGHETYEPELVSLRPPELVQGLEKYALSHHLDYPLNVTTDFFYEQVVDKTAQTFRQENIFSTDQGVPNWLLLFTVDDPERFRCHRCEPLMLNFKKLAEELQLE